MAKDHQGKSIQWIVVVAMIFVAYLGWGFMAGSYADIGREALSMAGRPRSVRTGRGFGIALLVSAVVTFVGHSISEIPNFFSVISYHLSNRIWLPIIFLVLEALILAGGWGLMVLEKKLDGHGKRPRKKRKRRSFD